MDTHKTLKPRLFLSYGRADATDIADRLMADLRAAGFQVWRDSANLHSGLPWDEQIQDAIHHSNLLLSVLTPHAVRVSTLTNPTGEDGVCLDEIAAARFAKPRVPILPLLALPCAPPFVIQRLHYLDFTRWKESDATWAQLFETLLAEAQRLLDGQPERLRALPLALIPFDTYLKEKQNQFTGREWLLHDIFAWLESGDAANVLFLVGPPGIGKSALIAQLIQRNPRGVLSAFHFCRADVADTTDPMRVIEHLCAMLAAQIPEYELALAGLLEQDQHRRPNDPTSFAERYLIEPLARSTGNREGYRAIAIDGLDEGNDLENAFDVIRLIAHLARRLPGWLRFILTSRPAADVIRRFSFVTPHVIDADGEDNRCDVVAYIRAQLGGGSIDEPSLQAVDTAAGGNFLIAKTLSQLMRDNVIDISKLSGYQPSLSFLYASLMDRVETPPDDRELQVRLLQQIATTRRPVPREVLHDCLKHFEAVSVARFNAVFDRLSMLLVQDAGGLRLFHQSYFDWLVNEPTPHQVDVADGHRTWARFAVTCLRNDTCRDASLRYAAEQVLAHARLGADYDTWLAVVRSPELAARVPSLRADLWGRLPKEAAAVVALGASAARNRLFEELAAFYASRAREFMDMLELRRIEETAGLISAVKSTSAFASGDFRPRLYEFLAHSSTFIHLLAAVAEDEAFRMPIVKGLDAYDALFVPLMYFSEDRFSSDGLGLSSQVSDVAHVAFSEWMEVAKRIEFHPA